MLGTRVGTTASAVILRARRDGGMLGTRVGTTASAVTGVGVALVAMIFATTRFRELEIMIVSTRWGLTSIAVTRVG